MKAYKAIFVYKIYKKYGLQFRSYFECANTVHT